MLQVGDKEKSPPAHGFESLDPFFRVSKLGPCFTVVEEDGQVKLNYHYQHANFDFLNCVSIVSRNILTLN